MKAVIIDKPIINPADLKVVNQDKPSNTNIQNGQILVKNQHVGVNFIDIYMRRDATNKGTLLGKEGSGTVVASKDARFKEGDCVGYLNNGSYAEYVVVDPNMALAIKPDEAKMMASFLLQGLTATYLTELTYKVQKGDRVLVPAAAGGTGSLICQACKAKGAMVIGMVGSKEKMNIAKEYCDHVINYKENPNWHEQVRKLCPEGIKVAYDGVGKSIFNDLIKCFGNNGGYLVNFGMASGPIKDSDCPKQITVIHDSLFNHIKTPEEFKNLTTKALNMLHTGIYKPRIHRIFKFDEVAQAHTELENQKSIGKILLSIE